MVSTIEWGYIRTTELSIVIRWKWEQATFLDSISVQFSRVQLFETPWTAAHQPSLSITNSEFTQTLVCRVGDAIQPSYPMSSPFPPAPKPSQHQGLSNESTLRVRWPKYWSFSFSISPSNEHPGLISFRMDRLDLLASKELSSIFSNTTFQKHQFFSTQLSSQSNSHIHTWPMEKP